MEQRRQVGRDVSLHKIQGSMIRYVTMPMDEYEALVADNKRLRELVKKDLPDLDDVVGISTRLWGHLNRMGIKNISELGEHDKFDFMRIPGFGKKSFDELKNWMKFYGLEFKK